jgi:DNA-directed RNA polymerase subunit RPC12/RpoP
VPDKSITIVLKCGSCGLKISVPRTHAGKKGRCPNCKNPIAVPAEKSPVPKLERNDLDDTSRLVGNDVGLTLIDVPEELKLADEQIRESSEIEAAIEQRPVSAEQLAEDEQAESDGRRKLPWIIDIFLYPVSLSGLTHLAIFTIVPTLIAILRTSLGIAGRIVGLLGFIINILIFLYMGWYFTECVRDSAKGGIRAPEAFASMGAGEMWSQMQLIIGSFLILLSPAFFYNLYTGNLDAIYWGLLITGSFFFPMGLLACIMFDSIRGLNPVLLLGSIFSTFFQYCGLVLLVIAIFFSFTKLISMLGLEGEQQPSGVILLAGGVFYFIGLYIVFVIAHLIGRFYWRYQDKLNWEV